MKPMIRNLFKFILPAVCLSLAVAGCKRDLDCNDQTPILELKLTFELDDFLGTIPVTYDLPGEDEYELRFIVDLYPDDIENPQLSDRIDRMVRYVDHYTTGDNTVTLLMNSPERKVKLLIWSDFVTKERETDLYYDTRDLTAVRIIDPYAPGSTLKSAFEAVTVIDPAELTDGINIENIPMEMPLGAYQITATDVAEYMAQPGVAPVEDLTTAVSYNLWLPVGYNVLTHKTNAFMEQVSFTASASDITDDSVVLASDYVFVSKETAALPQEYDTNVSLNFEVRDEGGNAINGRNNLVVPLSRGYETLLTGSFLTQSNDSGIGIDPDFDGDEIEIPYNR